MKHLTGLVKTIPVFFILGPFDPLFRFRMAGHSTLPNGTRFIKLMITHFKCNISIPRTLIRLPFHPTLEYFSCAAHITKQLFHMHILVPQLVYSRQDRNSPVKQIARMINIAHFQFLLRVSEPEGYMVRVHVKRSLKYRPCSVHLTLGCFPSCITYPCGHVSSQTTDRILKLSALSRTIIFQLFIAFNTESRSFALRRDLSLLGFT